MLPSQEVRPCAMNELIGGPSNVPIHSRTYLLENSYDGIKHELLRYASYFETIAVKRG